MPPGSVSDVELGFYTLRYQIQLPVPDRASCSFFVDFDCWKVAHAWPLLLARAMMISRYTSARSGGGAAALSLTL